MAHNHGEHHQHSELQEALELTNTRRGRTKLLVAGLGNGALMLAAGTVAHKSGAQATWIESIHDLGDMGYYIAPWAVSFRYAFSHNTAVRWMRRTAYTAASLASISMAHSVYDAAVNGFYKPETFSAPSQIGFAAGNALIAAWVAHKPGNTLVDAAAMRHAKNDARTSIVAGLGNLGAVVCAPLNPLSALVVGAMTINTERKTIIETGQALSAEDTECV